MKILSNKYFILGNLLLLLISIPVTLFFIKRQQDLQSRAAPSSKLYFNPQSPNTNVQCTSFNVDVMVDPGQNIVSIVDFYITYDPAKLDILQIKESPAFPTVVRPTSITSGEANMSVSVGADVTKAVQTISKVATITFRPKVAGPAQVQFDSTRSRVFSLAPADEPTENVLSTVSPSNVNVQEGACTTGGTPGVSPTGGTTPSPTGQIQPTTAISPTISPTSAANSSPVCTSFTVSPSATGSAPFSVLFTAKGNDPDTGGVITKTTFNYGDGSTKDVTDGMNLKDVTVQDNHTFQNAGTYNSSVTFTDDNGSISQSCATTLNVTGATPSGTVTPTSSVTATLVPSTATPTAAPTIPPTGGIIQTLGIIAAVVLTVVGGFVLLAL